MFTDTKTPGMEAESRAGTKERALQVPGTKLQRGKMPGQLNAL